ncbi:hypothetical protein BDV12DRAFT_188581 [Aspergillus spectabilis]
MDPFSKLPAEIIQEIVCQGADFIGVNSLLTVSPWVNAVFRAQPQLITSHLITFNPMTQTQAIQDLCWKVTLIHCPIFSSTSLDDYIEQTRPPQTRYTFPGYVSTDDLSRIIQITAQIQRLMCICLSTMQRSFLSALRTQPEQAQNANDSFSWIEQYRVAWALWHLQHFSDLQTAARIRWNWSAGSLSRLDQYLVWNKIDRPLAEQIWTVAAVLADLGLHPTYQTLALNALEIIRPHAPTGPPRVQLQDQPDQEPTRPIWHYPTEAPLPFFPSLHLPQAIEPPYTPCSCTPTPSPDIENSRVSHYWGLTLDHGAKASRQVAMFTIFGSQMSQEPDPDYTLWQMRPFRRLGVVIWDPWRLNQSCSTRVILNEMAVRIKKDVPITTA